MHEIGNQERHSMRAKTYASDFYSTSSCLLSEKGTQELGEDDGGEAAKCAETVFSVSLSARLDDRGDDGVLVFRLMVFFVRSCTFSEGTDGSLSWPSAGLEAEEGETPRVSRIRV